MKCFQCDRQKMSICCVFIFTGFRLAPVFGSYQCVNVCGLEHDCKTLWAFWEGKAIYKYTPFGINKDSHRQTYIHMYTHTHPHIDTHTHINVTIAEVREFICLLMDSSVVTSDYSHYFHSAVIKCVPTSTFTLLCEQLHLVEEPYVLLILN